MAGSGSGRVSRVGVVKRSGGRLWLGFPAALRLLFVGDLVTAVGVGLTQPYLVILLYAVKGVPLVTATAMTSLLALASFPGNWLAGGFVDRLGGHAAMGVGLAAAAAGLVGVAAGRGVPTLSVGVALVGFGWSVTLPAYATLIARLVAEGGQARAFTVQYALLNAGIGAGAAAGAVLTHRSVHGLPVLWWVAAGTCVFAGAAVWRSRAVAGRTGGPADTARPAGGYRLVLADRALRRVLLPPRWPARPGTASTTPACPCWPCWPTTRR